MANISFSYGNITIQKEKFTLKMQELLESCAQISGEYGMDISPASKTKDEYGNIQYDFDGYGRWSMDCTLPWCITNSAKGQELAKLMDEREATINISFIDYECGCCFLVKEMGVLSPIFLDGEWKFEFQSTEEEIPYNDFNKVKYEVEEGITLSSNKTDSIKILMKERYLDSLYQEIKKEFNLSKKEFISIMYNKIIEDDELDGGLCYWRIDDWEDNIDDFLDELSYYLPQKQL